jgi:hypothetical protein
LRAPSTTGPGVDPGRALTRGWFAVDADGQDLATGRPPSGQGAASALEALTAAPVASWPLAAVRGRRRLRLATVLGRGGRTVERLIDALAGRARQPLTADLAVLAASTPGGHVDLPLALVDPAEGARAAAGVDPLWLARLAAGRSAARGLLVSTGRSDELEAALHVALLVADGLQGHGEHDMAGRVVAGQRFWVLSGAIAWALTGRTRHPFRAWTSLLAGGFWPVGPSHGRLVVSTS